MHRARKEATARPKGRASAGDGDAFRNGSFSGITVKQPPGGRSSLSLGTYHATDDIRRTPPRKPPMPSPNRPAQSAPSDLSGPDFDGSHALLAPPRASELSMTPVPRASSFSGTRRLAPPGGFSSMGSIFGHADVAPLSSGDKDYRRGSVERIPASPQLAATPQRHHALPVGQQSYEETHASGLKHGASPNLLDCPIAPSGAWAPPSPQRPQLGDSPALARVGGPQQPWEQGPGGSGAACGWTPTPARPWEASTPSTMAVTGSSVSPASGRLRELGGDQQSASPRMTALPGFCNRRSLAPPGGKSSIQLF